MEGRECQEKKSNGLHEKEGQVGEPCLLIMSQRGNDGKEVAKWKD